MPQRTFIIGIGSELPNSGVTTLCCQLQALLKKAAGMACTIIETRGTATRTLVQAAGKSENEPPKADDPPPAMLHWSARSPYGAASGQNFDWRTLNGITGRLTLVALPAFSETEPAHLQRWIAHCDYLLWVTTAQASPHLKLESLRRLQGECAQLPPTGSIANMVTGSHQGKRLMEQLRAAFALRNLTGPVDLGHLGYETSVAIATGRASTVAHCFPDSPAVEELQNILDRTLEFLAVPSSELDPDHDPSHIQTADTRTGLSGTASRTTGDQLVTRLGTETAAGVAAEVLRLRSTYPHQPELLAQIANALLEVVAQDPNAALEGSTAAEDRGGHGWQQDAPSADQSPPYTGHQHPNAPRFPQTNWRQLMELAARTGAG